MGALAPPAKSFSLHSGHPPPEPCRLELLVPGAPHPRGDADPPLALGFVGRLFLCFLSRRACRSRGRRFSEMDGTPVSGGWRKSFPGLFTPRRFRAAI